MKSSCWLPVQIAILSLSGYTLATTLLD